MRLFYTETSAVEQNIVARVLESGCLVNGPHIEALSQELTAYMGGKGGMVPCASGTDALVLALEELNCQGHGVIVPAMTFSATYEAVLKAGAIPIICDVDDRTVTPSVEQIRDCIVNAVASGFSVHSILLVHLYGWPAYWLPEIAEFCQSHRFNLIEDCCQAFGASRDGKLVGTWGDAAAFSFYPTKSLGGIGDGGAVYFPDANTAQRAAAARNHGRLNGSQQFPGYNSRMDETNAAVIRHRLAFYENNINERRAISGRYHQNGMKKLSFLRQGKGVPYVYPIMVDNREDVQFQLAEAGIPSGVHYYPAVSDLPYVGSMSPGATMVSKRVLSLPCHHGMEVGDVDRICDAFRGNRAETQDLSP